MATTNEEMQATYEEETGGGFAATGLRGIIDLFGDEAISEDLGSLLDIGAAGATGSMPEEYQGEGFSEMSFIQDIENAPGIMALLGDLGTAGELGGLAVGALSPGSKFKNMGEMLMEVQRRFKDSFIARPPSQIRSDRRLNTPERIESRANTMASNIIERNRSPFDAHDLGLTDELPDMTNLQRHANLRDIDISDIVEDINTNAIPTRPRSKYSDSYANPQLSTYTETYPERTKVATDRQRRKLVNMEQEEQQRLNLGLPVRNNVDTRKYRTQGDQAELDFRDEQGLGSLKYELNQQAEKEALLRKRMLQEDTVGRLADADRAKRLQKAEAERLRDIDPDRMASGGRPGLYANINAKRKRIAAGSGETMRKKGDKGAPTAANFRESAKTAKKANGGGLNYMKGYYGKSYK